MHIALVSSPKKSINFVRGHEIDKTAFVVDIQGGRIHPFCFVLKHKYHSFEIKISKESI